MGVRVEHMLLQMEDKQTVKCPSFGNYCNHTEHSRLFETMSQIVRGTNNGIPRELQSSIWGSNRVRPDYESVKPSPATFSTTRVFPQIFHELIFKGGKKNK
jgi:hypothetical protein